MYQDGRWNTYELNIIMATCIDPSRDGSPYTNDAALRAYVERLDPTPMNIETAEQAAAGLANDVAQLEAWIDGTWGDEVSPIDLEEAGRHDEELVLATLTDAILEKRHRAVVYRRIAQELRDRGV